ncbi:MAG: arylsulfatase [Paludibacter sp.]
MKFNNLLLPAVSLLALNATAKEKQPVSKPTDKPNIVFILADDMGYHELGSFGGKVIETPNIDALAKDGMKFMNHYCGSNISAPSRGSLMTGKHTGHAWIRDNKALPFEGNEPIPASEVTVAEVLKSAGYVTGAFGKWGLGYPGSEGSPNKQGFDMFYGYNCQRHAHDYFTNYMRQNDDSITIYENIIKPFSVYSANTIKDEALKFIGNNKSKPFFLYFAPTLPHEPYHQPDDSVLAYYTNKTGFPKGDAHALDFSVPKYASLTSRLDREVGEIVAKLKALNLLDNTLIIFASDNGTALRPDEDSYLHTGGDLHGRKGEVYDGGVKSPFIAYWKGKVKPGTSSDHISAFWDFLPTCAELVNVAKPENIDGISYLPTLLGQTKKQKEHEYLYWERNQCQGIRKGDMKADIFYNKETKAQTVEIYNLVKDPYEKTDISASMPQLKEEFINIAKSAHVDSKIFPFFKKIKKTKKQEDEE